ncbi:MAG: Nif3-like dinuclear metal center hexameric protein [Bifidobacteriaceae bacterium]|nr:Nif3-like dinuclear metal center hexameric protein [Bifidobacteriaceae bacterium]
MNGTQTTTDENAMTNTTVILKQVVDVLETLYPLRYAESWDAPGLIVGELDWPVRRIYCAVDPTYAVVQEAIAWHADLLFTHHPLFFRSVHTVGGQGFRGEIVSLLCQAHCGLWAGHTNADAAYRGQAQAAADAFGLIDEGPLVPIDDPTAKGPVGSGRVGHLPHPMSLRDFAQRVHDALIPTQLGVQVAGDLDAMVSRVAVLPGSGDSLFDDVRRVGADVYVTSDLRHHPVTDAFQQAAYEARMRAKGIPMGTPGDAVAGTADATPRPAFINTPHSAIERMLFRYAIPDVTEALQQRCGAHIEMRMSPASTDPWTLSLRY